jgi:hypothetical protein
MIRKIFLKRFKNIERFIKILPGILIWIEMILILKKFKSFIIVFIK